MFSPVIPGARASRWGASASATGRARPGNRHRVQRAAQGQRHGGGVFQRGGRGVFRRQHHAAHIRRSDRICGNRCHQCRIDPARQPQQDPFEPGLAQIIRRAQNHRPIIVFDHVGQRRHRAGRDPPALGAFGEFHAGKAGVEGGHLKRQHAAGVQPETRPVEDLVILAANQIEVDERQAGLDHAGHHQPHAHIHLAPRMRRAIGDKQHLGPGLGQRLGHVRVPGILADRGADPQRPDLERPRHRAGCKDALFVEHIGVRQVVLDDPRSHCAIGQHRPAVEDRPVAHHRQADAQCRAARRQRCQRGQRRLGGLDQGAPPDEVLQLIAGQEHLGQRQHVGAHRRGPGMRRPRLRGIAGNVAHLGVELAERQAETLCHPGPHAARPRPGF